MVQGSSYHCEFNLFYDVADAKECNRVKELSESATRSLLNHGAFFSRPYGNSAGTILNRDAASIEVLRTFKRIFDPNNVMNPGKVCF
jgi:FAD/FMN-containing dehydrogenase